MYRVEFYLDFFGGDLAFMSQSYRIAGAGKNPRVKFVGANRSLLGGRDFFVAKSSKPFVVVITTKADGENTHRNGETTILVATDRDGNSGASMHASMGGDHHSYRRLHVDVPTETTA